jgi:hypothetical protein
VHVEQHKKEMMQHSKGLADMASKHENEMRDQMKAHQVSQDAQENLSVKWSYTCIYI